MTILNLMKMAESSQNGKKALWEKEKLLVTSNFSFSHRVFKKPVQQTPKNQGLFGKWLILNHIVAILSNSPFPTIYSIISQPKSTILATSKFSSVNAFNFGNTQFLLFGAELRNIFLLKSCQK